MGRPNQCLEFRLDAWPGAPSICSSDDRFEQNDVTSRCQQIVAIFQWFFLDLLSLGSYRVEPIPTRLSEEWLAACRELKREGRVGDPWPAYDTLGMVEPGGELESRLQQIPEDLWTRPG